MSKFWGAASGSSSDSDSSSSSEEAMQIAQPKRQMQRWAEASSSEEDTTTKRVVKSQKDKRFDDLREKLKVMRNHQKIDDFSGVVQDYELILKAVEKVTKMNEDAPHVFIRTLVSLEDYVAKVKDSQSDGTATKFTKNKATAFNTLRAKIRKGNKAYEAEVKSCRDNPENYESQDEAEDEEQEGSEASSRSSDSDSSSSSDSGSDSSSDSDSDSDSDASSDSDWKDEASSNSDADSDVDEATLRERKLRRWLIDSDDEDEEEKRRKKKDEKEENRKKKEEEQAKRREAKGEMKDPTMGENTIGENMNLEEIQKKVTELMKQRGRKGQDKNEILRNFGLLLEVARKFAPNEPLTILSLIIQIQFDHTTGAFQAMPLRTWVETMALCNEMIKYILEDENAAARSLQDDDSEDEDESGDEERVQKPTLRQTTVGVIVSFVEKFDDELFKALQLTDVHTEAYQERLGGSVRLISMLKVMVKFCREDGKPEGEKLYNAELARMSIRLLEHLYYKHDDVNTAVSNAVRNASGEECESDEVKALWDTVPLTEITDACKFIHKHGQPREKIRATLCQVYHHALHGRFYHARDLMQLSGVQESVQTCDVLTLILFNRALVMVGLAAFRLGKLLEALSSLMEVCALNRAKELLAQGLAYSHQLRQERTPEQEKQERRRQMPYHMHISLDVVESAHYLCAMLLEVPNMAQHPYDSTRSVISKSFRRQLEQYDRNMFAGSENSRESVMVAARALLQGNWQKSVEAIGEMKFWDLLQDKDTVKPMIEKTIRLEGMRTYLFQYSGYYHSFSVEHLANMFDLDVKLVRSTVSRMLINQQIHACWDEDTKYVLVHHVEPSRLQTLALQLAERAALAVESNERMLDGKAGLKDLGRNDRWADRAGVGAGRRAGFAARGDRRQQGGRGKGGKGGGKNQMKRGWENARAGSRQVGRVYGAAEPSGGGVYRRGGFGGGGPEPSGGGVYRAGGGGFGGRGFGGGGGLDSLGGGGGRYVPPSQR